MSPMSAKTSLPIVDSPCASPMNQELPYGNHWWRSLEELAGTARFQELLHREFPGKATELDSSSRRDFLRLIGASLMLAGAPGCNIKQPQEKIVPSARMTGHSKPGLPTYYATAMDLAGSAIGLTVQSRDGRPIKIEGNAHHPSSLGATGVFAQAATLDLYDPDRIRTATARGDIVPRDRVSRQMAVLRKRMDETEGAGLRVLIGTSTSPTLHRLLRIMNERWPRSRWDVHEPVNDDHQREALSEQTGERRKTPALKYDFSKARTVVAVDCDFLGGRDGAPCYIRQFARARKVVGRAKKQPIAKSDMGFSAKGRGAEMIRLYHLGSTPTLTSAKADQALAIAPRAIIEILRRLAESLPDSSEQQDASSELLRSRRSSSKSLNTASKSLNTAASDRATDFEIRLLDDLRSAHSNAVIVVGRQQPPEVHALAFEINRRIGAIGNTVHLIDSPLVRPANQPSDVRMLQRLSGEMSHGEVESLLILGGNPVFDAPADIPFAEAIRNVPFSLSLVDALNETSSVTGWVVPRSHFLEAWGDVRGHDGTASIVQPLISPLYESFSDIEILAMLCEEAASGYAAVRRTWAKQLGTRDDDSRWKRAVADGVIPNDSAPRKDREASNQADGASAPELQNRSDDRFRAPVPTSAKEADTRLTRSEFERRGGASIEKSAGERLDLVFRPDPTIWDGRFANNGWLQELPKPLTHIVWDNVAQISPGDAARLNLQNGDLVGIGEPGSEIEIAVWIVPGHAEGCLTLFYGYGRRIVGRVGQATGVNVHPLRRVASPSVRQGVPLRKLGRQSRIVTTQHFQTMEGRHIARSGTLQQYQSQPENPPFAHPPSPMPESSMYSPWKYVGHKWGMTIDLTACVGCSACVIACQAENNIPVVGKTQCDMNRHMHWIRVDTYYQGPPERPHRTLHQPVPCMHCETAPCEVVCPVAATNHSNEGINQMVYNRCVGTRYCSNNCPYKVRRFNFLDFADEFLRDPSLHLLANPEVTVRSRGVMEKCTYCIQRIEQARIAAQLEDRKIADGDIKTACQAVCPAEAIRFGDLNDPGSEVRATHDHPLNYGLLEELNTKPRTTYLAEVVNPPRANVTGTGDVESEDRSSTRIPRPTVEVSD